jgi:nucleoside-diphosphate-sugar epimerase
VFAIHGDPFDPAKVIAIDGDVLDTELPARLRADPRLADIDTVLHAAANTSFLRSNDASIEAINVGGLERVVAWARELPRLRTFVYIGTAMICGPAPRPGPVGEDESPDPAVRQLVRYTSTKVRAELLLQRAFPADRLLVVRPSIILADSRPVAPRSLVVMWAMAAINQLRLVPTDGHAPLDIIPADYAADAVSALLLARRHGVYHISAGPSSATSVKLLSDTLARHFPALPPFCFVASELLPEIRRWIQGHPLAAGSALAGHRSYLDDWQARFRDTPRLLAVFTALAPNLRFMELGHVFDNTRLLAATGMHPPTPAHVYMVPAMHHLAAIDIVGEAWDQ